MKKFYFVCCFGAFLLLPVLSPAQKATTNASANTTPTTNASGDSLLGTIEGVVYFCDKVNRNSASGYKQIDHLLVDGQTAKTLNQIRNSDAYESTITQTNRLLGRLPAKEALAVCNAH
jgi:hypothetical protein